MFSEEATYLLVNGGVGVANTNIFVSSKASIPAGDGPFMSLIVGGGTVEPTHNQRTLPAYVHVPLQLFVRGSSYPACYTMLMMALAVLYPIQNRLVLGVWWRSVTPLQAEPIDLGQDDSGRFNASLNFVIVRRPNAALSS